MNSEEVLNKVLEIIQEVTEDWDLEDSEISPSTRLSADLGFSSVDVVQLFASLSTGFQQKFRYDRLIVDESGQYRDELTIAEIASYLEKELEQSGAN